MIDIQIDNREASKVLEKLIPILSDAILKDNITPYNLYYALMEVIFINRRSAKQIGIPDEVLSAIEFVAHKEVEKKIKEKGTEFYN